MQRNHFRTGRPKKLTKHDIRHLIGILRSGWEGRKFSWAKLEKTAGLHVSSKTIKRVLNLKGYHQCRACKMPFINRETQHARKLYSMIHLHKPVEFWQSHMYSMSVHSIHPLVALLGSLNFDRNAATTTASITISKVVGLR
jgi:hypothetical protein